jgi:rfaE bifunctional protein nucleotidyltransferase chain/domain
MKYRSIITSHTNPTLSGVAKFNSILADMMGIPRMTLRDLHGQRKGPLLLSIKLKDVIDSEIDDIQAGTQNLWRRGIVYDVFFHSFDGLEMEFDLAKNANWIFCANREIYRELQGFSQNIISAWCPALLREDKALDDEILNIFSFGMAHKIQIRYYRMLHDLLEEYGIGYSLKVSTAFHEKANFGDFNLISHQLAEIFSDNIQFLGFLSDDAVNFFLHRSHLFVAFFDRGVRSNNTSIFAAMERGCAVLTNCDEYSPEWMKPGANILDLHHIGPKDFEAEYLKKIGESGKKFVKKNADWQGLVRLLNGSSPTKSLNSRVLSGSEKRATPASFEYCDRGKVVTKEKLALIVDSLKKRGKSIVLTSGCFDILHVGHKRFLQEAKKTGDFLILCLNTDNSVRRIKGPGRPIMNQEDRAELILSLGFVDYIVYLEEDTASSIIAQIEPHVYVKGEDYRGKDNESWPEAKLVKDYGGEVKLIDLYKGRSTTDIVEKIMKYGKRTT